MLLEVLRGDDLRDLMEEARRRVGEDAMVLQARVVGRGASVVHEVVVAAPASVEMFLRRVDAGATPTRRKDERRPLPLTVALVGPAGWGKTAAALRLALHPFGFGRRRTALVTLDTFRPGAVEEMRTWAELTGVPFDVAYEASDARVIRERLHDVEVVIVDTPGRDFGRTGQGGWLDALRAFAPDEVHLAVPAGVRSEVAVEARARFAPCGVTHALYTRLDEAPGAEAVIALAEDVGLPARWAADGPEVPGHLAPAVGRILSWGSLPPTPRPARRAGEAPVAAVTRQ